jgi:hypothetical protein
VLRKINLDGIRSVGYTFLTEMKFNLHQRGVQFGEFPIVFCERESGKSKFSRKILYEGMRPNGSWSNPLSPPRKRSPWEADHACRAVLA